MGRTSPEGASRGVLVRVARPELSSYRPVLARGSSCLAKTLCTVINSHGSACFVRAPVESIVVDSGTAVGVVCKGLRLEAVRGVISNAGAANTYERLVPKAYGAPCVAALRDAQETKEEPRPPQGCDPSVQLVYLFVGLDGSDADLDLPACNYWCLTPGGPSKWDHDAAMQAMASADKWGDVPIAACFLSLGSSKDDSHHERHPGKATRQGSTRVQHG